MYVSITRLKLKSIWRLREFIKMSNEIFEQAQNAPGNLNTKLSNRWFRYFYTQTHWNSREAMQQFVVNGAHREAMKQWKDIAMEIKVHGFETSHPPKWKLSRQLVAQQGRVIS